MTCPNASNLQQCPCCDFFTLDERGAWEICPVCFWEDGDTDLDCPDERSGCNHGLTLRLARANFLQFGACEEAMLEYVCAVEERRQYRHEPRSLARNNRT
jgi:hypothetical protein